MRKLAIFSAAFASAAACYVYWFSDVRALWIAGACLGFSVLVRTASLRRLSVAFLGIAMGLLWCCCYQQLWLKDVFLLDGTEQTVQVRVTQCPYQTGFGAAADCELDGHGAVLYADSTLLAANPGDTVACSAQVKVQTDDLFNRSNGTILCLYAQSEISLERGMPSFSERIRIWLQRRIDTLYDDTAAGLVKALLTGDRSGLSYETSNHLSVAGLSHAVAVSGMHVSILITVVAMLCSYSPICMAAFGIPVVVLFAVMTGASASVCRAAVMQILLLLAPLVRRERDNATTLSAAALVLLVQNPWCIANVSFQLSFAAVAGLMLFSETIRKRIVSLREKPGRVLKFIASGVSATLGASILTLPFTIFYFGMVSIAAPLVNLLVLWAVTGVFTLGLCSCMLGSILAWPAAILCEYILGACALTASFPYAAAYPYQPLLMIWAVLWYLLPAAIFTFRRIPVRWSLCTMTAAFLGCVLFGRLSFVQHPWRMTALDVGQGQCIVLQLGDFTALVDCGGSNPQGAGEHAARFLHSAGIMHADAVILTHYDDDHAGGTAQFLSRVDTAMVFCPSVEELVDLGEYDGQIYEVNTSISLEAPGGSLTLFPPVSQENDNNSGICVLATAGEYDILITGDLDQMAEMRLMSQWELPDVELLVAGHHGAATSTSCALLEAVDPETVVISVGKDNSYGHPHAETLQRIRDVDAQIFRTDFDGTISIHP